MHLPEKIAAIAALTVSCILAVFAQPAIGKDITVERIYPSRTGLANMSIAILVEDATGGSGGVVSPLRAMLESEILNGNKSLRLWAGGDTRELLKWLDRSRVTAALKDPPDVVLKCALTQWHYREGERKDSGAVEMFISARASYLVASPLKSYDAGEAGANVDNREPFFMGYIIKPGVTRRSIEEVALRSMVYQVARSVADVAIPTSMRLMDKDGLDRPIEYARTGQWTQYVDALVALPNKPGDREYEADRKYNLAVAYESLAYEQFLRDTEKSQQYVDLARRNLKEAQELDPKEKEYVKASSRVDQTEDYLEEVRRKRLEVETLPSTPLPPPPTGLTNDDIIKMVKAKLPSSVIVNKIRSEQNHQFDLSTDGLIALSKAGVSESIITEMQRKAAED